MKASSQISVRLACVRHAASVRPEPGSNSLKIVFNRPCGRLIHFQSLNRSFLRLALRFFWFPGVCPLRLEYFVFLKRITGSFSCFRCLIFKVLCAPLSSKALDYFTTSSWLCQELFFGSFFLRAFLFYHTVSGLSRTFFSRLAAELFYLSTTTQGLSRFFSAPLSA